MTLSYRALAFSVDNLLRPSAHSTKDAVGWDSSLSQSAETSDLSSCIDVSGHSTWHRCIRNGDTKGRHEVDMSGSLVKCSHVCSSSIRHVEHTVLAPQNADHVQEQDKLDLEDEEISIDLRQRFEHTANGVTRQHGRDSDFYRLPFITKSKAKEKTRIWRPQCRKSETFSYSSPPSPSCFRHGEATFCHHPGIISVIDSRGSNRVVIANLCHADLWNSFHGLGTEMIITKSGRRMFPAFKVNISGLNPEKLYTVRLDFLQPDTRKYRYIYHSSRWMVSGSGDVIDAAQPHKASQGPISGQAICSQVVSFESLKLTNTEPTRAGQVSLVSMQKFQPQVVVEEVSRTDSCDVSHTELYVILFPQTSFMAVTAYQNHQITTLKIASNPFAKGFRESGKTRIPYEPFMHHVPVACKTALDYLHGIVSSPYLPAFFQREGLNVRNGKRLNDGLLDKQYCTSMKTQAREVDNSDRYNSVNEKAKFISHEPSSLQTVCESTPSYFHPNHERRLEHLLQLQQKQQDIVPTASHHRLHPLLYQSLYHSSLLQEPTSTAAYAARPQRIPASVIHMCTVPSSAYAPFQNIPIQSFNKVADV